MAGRKHVILDEPQCVIGKTPARDGTPMLFHELAEIIGMDDVGFCSCCGWGPRLEPTKVNPFLYFVGAGVQCAREGKLGEPFPPCFAAYAEPMQHRANRSRRPSQEFRGLFYGHCRDQVKKTLLLGLGPLAIRAFMIDAKLAQETQAGVSRVPRNLRELCDQHSPVRFMVLLASAGSFLILSGLFPCLFFPGEHTG